MQIFSKEYMIPYLKEGICTVTFEKKDGTIRKMKCTLNKEFIPSLEIHEEAQRKKRIENSNVLSIYDVENNEWRSFRLNSVIEFKG